MELNLLSDYLELSKEEFAEAAKRRETIRKTRLKRLLFQALFVPIGLVLGLFLGAFVGELIGNAMLPPPNLDPFDNCGGFLAGWDEVITGSFLGSVLGGIAGTVLPIVWQYRRENREDLKLAQS